MTMPHIECPVELDADALAMLMPMHVVVNAMDQVISIGPTLEKLLPEGIAQGARITDLFTLRRPLGPLSVEHLCAISGMPLQLALSGDQGVLFRGLAVATSKGGAVLNLSFGIAVTEAVHRYKLTIEDFAVTDLAVEMLYLVEANSAVLGELRSLNRRLHGDKIAAEEQALTDSLTGLRNRRALDLRLQALTSQGQSFGLMHIDLDFFKQVNDTLGHAAGDHVLCEAALILADETRASDLIARVGGDEFILVLPGLADAVRLINIANRIITRLSQPINYNGQSCSISGSIGLTLSDYYNPPDIEWHVGRRRSGALCQQKRGS